MAKAREALTIARALLGDDEGIIWTDQSLMGKMRLAFSELISKMELNGLAVVREESAEITVTTGAKNLGVNLPTNIVEPNSMEERGVGESPRSYVEMRECDFIPDADQTATLRYWAWRENVILFLGATADRVVKLHYIKSLTAPKKVTEDLPIEHSEIFLGPRIAALTAIGKDQNLYESANTVAEGNLSKLVRTLVKGQQGLPVRRRPFSYRMRSGRRIAF